MTNAISKDCPQCGATVKVNKNICEYCGASYYIKSLDALSAIDKKGVNKYLQAYKKAEQDGDNEEVMLAMGICYIKLGMHDFAIKYFNRAIDQTIDDADIYFYSSVALLKGKRPFLTPLTIIRQIEERLEAAQSINPGNPRYYFAQALIKIDYYEKKRLKSNPSISDLLDEAETYNLSDLDKDTLYDLFNLK